MADVQLASRFVVTTLNKVYANPIGNKPDVLISNLNEKPQTSLDLSRKKLISVSVLLTYKSNSLIIHKIQIIIHKIIDN